MVTKNKMKTKRKTKKKQKLNGRLRRINLLNFDLLVTSF